MEVSQLDFVLVALTLSIVGVGLALIPLAIRKKQANLWWLVGVFIFNISTIFLTEKLAPDPILFHIGGFAIQFSLIMFLHTTFYKDRQSPYLIFLFLTILGFGFAIYFAAQGNSLALTLNALVVVMNWSWHLFIALAAYQKIRHDPHVEDWVKTRFILMIYYALCVLITNIAHLPRVFSNEIANALAPVALFAGFAGIILQYLTWTMPEVFRNWLNRNQQAHAEERLQEQALAILNILGSAMANGTGLSLMSALIVLRKAIGQEIETEDSDSIAKHASTMGYREWQALLKSRDFQLWVESLGVQGNPRQAIENATRALTEKQSLFTMQAK